MKLLLIPLFLLLAGCDSTFDNPLCNFNEKDFVFGNATLNTDIACSKEDKMKGLMNIQSLEKNKGMLFVYDKMDYHNFWMKNTNIPLSIAFIDSEWTIVDIKDMNPLDETHIHPVKPALYAVEANKGWFAQHNVKVGDTVYLKP